MSEVPLQRAEAAIAWHANDAFSKPYRGTSLTRKRTPLGPYRRPMPRVLGGSYEGGRFFRGVVPLYRFATSRHAKHAFSHAIGEVNITRCSWHTSRFILGTHHVSFLVQIAVYSRSTVYHGTHHGLNRERYRGTSLTRNSHSPLGPPYDPRKSYCRVLGRGCFL